METKTFYDIREDIQKILGIKNFDENEFETFHIENIQDILSENLSYSSELSHFYFSKAIFYNMQIFVKTERGKTLPIDFSALGSIFGLKKKVKEIERIPIIEQELLFAGKQLQDDKTLADYNIEKESTIDLVSRRNAYAAMKGFVDLESNKTMILKFSDEAPEWRRVSKGLKYLDIVKI